MRRLGGVSVPFFFFFFSLNMVIKGGGGHTDIDITQSSQSLAELSNLLLVDLDLLALGILVAALLLGVEAQVLQEDDLATRGLVDDLLDLLANAVLGEDDAAAEQLLQLGNHGLQAVLVVLLAIRTTQVGHEDDRLGTILDGVLDGGQGTDNTLVVGDLLLVVEGNVEVDLFGRMISVLPFSSSLHAYYKGKPIHG